MDIDVIGYVCVADNRSSVVLCEAIVGVVVLLG